MAKAKEKNKNSTKSFVMLIVTGITLVAVTLCWFALANSSSVDQVDSSVENDASSPLSIGYGVDLAGNIAIRGEDVKEYKKISDSTVILENIIPGAEYFYMAEFKNCTEGQTVSLSFEGIEGTLSSKIKVYRRLTTSTDTVIHSNGENEGTLTSQDFNKELGVGDYTVYFSFKFADDATVDTYGNSQVKINNVNIVRQ